MRGCPLPLFVDSSPCTMSEPVSPAVTKRGKNFKPSKSALLAASWLSISYDPINGADQQAEYFWKNIDVHYNAQKLASDPERTQQALQCHWTQVQRCVGKFSGIFNRIMNALPSGWSDENAFDESFQSYKESEKSNSSSWRRLKCSGNAPSLARFSRHLLLFKKVKGKKKAILL